MKAGTHVRVQNLKKASHLNGKLGIVTEDAVSGGRVKVRLSTGRGIQAKEQNLEIVPLVASDTEPVDFDAATCLRALEVPPPKSRPADAARATDAAAASKSAAKPKSDSKVGSNLSVHQDYDAHWQRGPISNEQIPSELHPFVYRPEPNGHETSLVILIHGKGADAHQCVQSMESLVGGLPQTSVLAITGPYPLAAVLGPDAPGALSPHAATWFPVVDLERTEVLPEPTFGDRGKGVRAGVDLRRIVALENRTRPLLRKLLENLVSPACGWRLHEIFLVGVGFGEGSVAAVDLMLHLGHFPILTAGRGADSRTRPVSRLGGVVAVDGVLPPELGATEHGCGRLLNFRPHLSAAAEAPVLLLMGQTPALPSSLSKQEGRESADRLRTILRGDHPTRQQSPNVKLVQTKRPPNAPHALLKEEVDAARQFFSEHLVLRNLGLEAQADVFQVQGGMAGISGHLGVDDIGELD